MQTEESDSTSANNLEASWAERNGFAHWVLALMWIVGAFLLFQFTASVVALVLIVVQEGFSAEPAQMMELLTDNLGLMFIGNSSGQILFLGLGTWFFTRLHVSKRGRNQFLRFKANSQTVTNIFLTVIIIVAAQPTIWFLSWLNAFIPVPDMFSNLQSSQMQMIEQYLRGDHLIILTLFHVALVPAICEETLYRGYVMRAFEKSWGIWPAIIVSGILFGMYHIQLSNLIPLAGLGILFAYLTWVADSIYPAIIAHLVNNGGSVLIGTYYPESAFAEITPESMPPIWGVIPSLLITAFILYWMYKQHTQKTA